MLEKYHRYLIIGFILFSSFIFSFIGKPVTVLVVVGALNGLILPIVLGSLLLAAKKEKIVGAYKHSSFLFYTGWLVFAVMLYMSLQTILKMLG
ncbi:hypothetical protein [Acidaminococcus fermentans]|uniref:hypothetical protein n=1 Tax=Acidaminococcus fermentans TaxID=905 RepID=UPI00242C5115|nr:hypothetical protein [Acidaminococcus fermentans]